MDEQSRRRAVYSSSESRTLIMRERGFRTVISDPVGLELALELEVYNHQSRSIGSVPPVESLTIILCSEIEDIDGFWAGFAPVSPNGPEGLQASQSHR